MFKYFAITTCVLGIATFGTEAIYRFRSDNEITDTGYITQSNTVISAAAISMILSVHMIKMTEFISLKAMRLLALISIGLLCIAVALRTKYKFMMTLPQESTNNIYNATSILICINIVCWIPFFVYKKPIDQSDIPTFPVTAELRRRRYEQLLQRRNAEQSTITPTGAGTNYHYGEGREEEMLPSYYELPAPPGYTKTEAITEEVQNDISSQQASEPTVTRENDVVITMDSDNQLPLPADTRINATTNDVNRSST